MSDTTGNGSSQPGATPPAATPAEPAGATTTAAPDTRPASPGRQASPTTSTAIHDITFRRVFRELIGFMWPYRKLFAISMTGALLFSLGANGRLLLLQPITDKVFMPGGDLADADKLQNLTWIVLAMLVITLIQGPAGWIRQYYGSQMSQKLRIDVQRHIQKHLLTLDMNFYIRHRQGDLMSRVLGDMGAVMGAVEHVLTALPVFVFLAVTGLAVAIYASWRLALLCTLVIPLLSFMLSFLSKRLRHWARMRSAAGGEVNDRLQESMNGIRVVKSFRREERERQRFIDATDTLYERSMAAVRYMTLNSSGVDFLYNLLIAGLVLLGGWLVLTTFTDANGNEYTLLTGGYLIMFIGALVSLYDPVRRISRSINMYQNAMAAAERVFEVLDLKPSIRDADDAVAHDTFESGVELDAVCFDYDEAADRAGSLSWDPVTSAPAEAKVADPDAPARRKAFNLQNVSFVAKKGEVIALVGERGSGKSTILDLILRLYDPTSGSVMIDGIDIR
ncbi:MAG: ABC transporter ATP-binding protein, partial [Planctomycetota bacterium]